MIDFKRIKMPELIVDFNKKGWFKGAGLHHASIGIVAILIGHLLGFGTVAAGIVIGWYGCKEYGGQIYPPKVFEIMDFASPLVVSIAYLNYDLLQ